eukprot:30087-Pelagococcus_subviridis.AAC.2
MPFASAPSSSDDFGGLSCWLASNGPRGETSSSFAGSEAPFSTGLARLRRTTTTSSSSSSSTTCTSGSVIGISSVIATGASCVIAMTSAALIYLVAFPRMRVPALRAETKNDSSARGERQLFDAFPRRAR